MELELERIREILRAPVRDNASGRALLEALRPQVNLLLEQYEQETGRDGGAFGRQLLEALEAKILKAVDGRVELTDEVSTVSCALAIVQGRVFVDVRLEVKCLAV